MGSSLTAFDGRSCDRIPSQFGWSRSKTEDSGRRDLPLTCSKVVRRHQLPRLTCLDRPTGRPVRRYEMRRLGELGQVDVKKLARIPDGGGHRVHGRPARPRRDLEKRRRVGFDRVHSLLDDHSTLAYSELLPDETVATCGPLFRRALAWFAERNVHFQAVMTDNACAYRNGGHYHQALAEMGARAVFIPPHTPYQRQGGALQSHPGADPLYLYRHLPLDRGRAGAPA